MFILDTCWAFFTTFDLTVLTRPMKLKTQRLAGAGSSEGQLETGSFGGFGEWNWSENSEGFGAGRAQMSEWTYQQPFLLLLLGSGAPGFLGRGMAQLSAASGSGSAHAQARKRGDFLSFLVLEEQETEGEKSKDRR